MKLRTALLSAVIALTVALPSTEARAQWRLPFKTPRQARAEAWNDWAHQNLQHGDLLFVQGDYRILLGTVNFSQFLRELTGSQFSHIAFVTVDQNGHWANDIVSDGPRRQRVEDFLLGDGNRLVAVKRVRPEYRARMLSAVSACVQICDKQVGFDKDFLLDNDTLYCTELIETGFRAADLPLSEPVPVRELPGYRTASRRILKLLDTCTSASIEEPVYVAGNESIGIWASPKLQLVLAPSPTVSPPTEHRSR